MDAVDEIKVMVVIIINLLSLVGVYFFGKEQGEKKIRKMWTDCDDKERKFIKEEKLLNRISSLERAESRRQREEEGDNEL